MWISQKLEDKEDYYYQYQLNINNNVKNRYL